MALNGTACADAAYAAFKSSISWDPSPEEDAKARAAWRAQVGAIIDYIKANAVVSVNVTTTGSAAAQSGTGTGTIA